MFKGDIEVINVAYELKATSNKRVAMHTPFIKGSVPVSIYTHPSLRT